MTAEELIAQLKALPPATQILVEGYETGYDDINELNSLDVFRYRNAQEWDGEYQTHESFSGDESATHPVTVIRGRRGHLRK